jgi:WD40 repeat protein
LEGHFSNVISVAITSDNTKIVSGSRENTIKIWDMNTGKLLNTLQGHFAVAITSDNTKIVSGSRENTIKVWDLDQLRYYLNNKFDSSISSIALSKSKNLIALGDSSGNLYSGILYS